MIREYVRRLPELLSTSLWFLPAAMLVASLVAVLGTTSLDMYLNQLPEARQVEFLITGSPEGAREILSTIAGSMLTLTGVVFSITMLVLQMASSQFSPRALRTFLRDMPSKLALGTFLGTFVFALVGLRAVRAESAPGGTFVPGVTVSVALLFVLASIGLLVFFIHHVATKIQVTSIIAGVGNETIHLIEHSLPERRPDEPLEAEERAPETPVDVPSQHSGVIVSVDVDGLVRTAQRENVCMVMQCAIGEFVPKGKLLLSLDREVDDNVRKKLLASIAVENARTMEQDVAFGFRQLTDIALRALSPSVNDPTTAVDVIHAEHDLLRRVGSRMDMPRFHHDDSGELRLVVREHEWEALLRIVFDEIGDAGDSFRRVREALSTAARDLSGCLPHDRLPGLQRVARRWLEAPAGEA